MVSTSRRDFLRASVSAASLAVAAPAWLRATASPPRRPPNFVVILADDLGYTDLGCYGSSELRTPHLDALAARGVRFTQGYCGTSVCAPSRCTLLTGRDTGHAQVRGNHEIKPEGQLPLAPGTPALSRHLRDVGYATACIGKWGLGMVGTSGDPLANGFDHFFGYNCQRQAHGYFPAYLWNDADRVSLDAKTYAPDLLLADAERFVATHADRPFFLHFTTTLPHSKFEIPDLGPYAEKNWSIRDQTYAAMVSRLDADCGRLFAALQKAGVLEHTVIVFASDNGPAFAPAAYASAAGLRGIKRSMYEGGLRVPFIVAGPGVTSGATCAEPVAFWDFFATFAELSGNPLSSSVPTEGRSFAPLLAAPAARLPARPLYWELHEGGFCQAYREGNWKLVRPKADAPLQLFDLARDPAEERDLAVAESSRLSAMASRMAEARVDDPNWPLQTARA